MTWYLALSLQAFRNEVDKAYPLRSRASDGTIGDAAHASRTSDHNPKSDGKGGEVVDALDLTHDPAHGFDAHGWARKIAARRDPRVKYLISMSEIWTPAAGWHPYQGTNHHDKHMHTSVQPTGFGRTSTSSWLLDLSSLTPQEAKMRVANAVAAKLRPNLAPQVVVMSSDGAMYAFNGAPYLDAYNNHPELGGSSVRAFVDFEWDSDGLGYTQLADDGSTYHWRAK